MGISVPEQAVGEVQLCDVTCCRIVIGLAFNS